MTTEAHATKEKINELDGLYKNQNARYHQETQPTE
jgi:hypothetical protein